MRRRHHPRRPDRPAPGSSPATPSAIAATVRTIAPGYGIPADRRGRGLVIVIDAGRLQLDGVAEDLAPHAGKALWLPPGSRCTARAITTSSTTTLTLPADDAARLPRSHAVFVTSAVVRTLADRFVATTLENADEPAMHVAHLHEALLEELRLLMPADAVVPLPSHQALRALCRAFVDDPGSRATLAEWGERFGLSSKTIARIARRELHMTFAAWQRGVRIDVALRRLRAGDSVTDVALDLGYGPSAFTAMFRRATGRAPSEVAKR